MHKENTYEISDKWANSERRGSAGFSFYKFVLLEKFSHDFYHENIKICFL